MKNPFPIFFINLIAFFVFWVPTVQAEPLFGYCAGPFNPDTLFTIETTIPSASAVGTDFDSGVVSEIEYGNGIIYAADTDVNTNLHSIDPATGQVISTLTLTFPADGNVLTALEFVGNTLYAGLCTEESQNTDSFLATVNLTTGVVTSVGGAMGVGHPIGGLAYDGVLMYAVSAGGSGELFTVNLSTGAATSVGPILVGETPVGTTALEFGASGTLYALPNIKQSIAGHLLSINPATGAANDLGDLGIDNMSSLTLATATPPQAIPTISEWGMIIMSFLLAGTSIWIIRRRQIV